VTPAAKAFSDALGEGSRMILRLSAGHQSGHSSGVDPAGAVAHPQTAQTTPRLCRPRLQLEKDRAQITLQSIGDGVITTDVSGAIEYMNPAAEAMTHWKAEQAAGLPLAALFNLLDDNAQAEGLTLIEHILSGGLSGGSEHSKLIQRLDGSTVSVNLVGAPIRHADKVSGTVLVLHDMTQERQYIANLSWQATHDALTGLANRREFEFRLEQALHNLTRQPGRHALMFLDLDQFKLVNDTCGHAAGDELLRHICALLQSVSARGRYPGPARRRRVRRAAGKLRAGGCGEDCRGPAPDCAEPAFRLEGAAIRDHGEYWSGAHVRTTSDHSRNFAARRRHGCYMAKEKGRNRVQVYHPDDSELSLRFGEMAWVQRLHMALEENRFCLYAQEIAPLGNAEVGRRAYRNPVAPAR
jgi:PAS domain S-box-containing protein